MYIHAYTYIYTHTRACQRVFLCTLRLRLAASEHETSLVSHLSLMSKASTQRSCPAGLPVHHTTVRTDKAALPLIIQSSVMTGYINAN
jgi:hypothetical protein